ncbi:MAG: hypothetical protein M3256_04070 [Actinomycetota bacterium]|nr:hypothetical protein [Actinomycetota bacterium]
MKTIFEGYVFGFMQLDIGREIHLAKLSTDEALKILGPYVGGANVLAALGLTCYSEYLGSFITSKKNAPRENWEAFLTNMGKCYADLIKTEGPKLWDTYRNGLAHEFADKRSVLSPC